MKPYYVETELYYPSFVSFVESQYSLPVLDRRVGRYRVKTSSGTYVVNCNEEEIIIESYTK